MDIQGTLNYIKPQSIHSEGVFIGRSHTWSSSGLCRQNAYFQWQYVPQTWQYDAKFEKIRSYNAASALSITPESIASSPNPKTRPVYVLSTPQVSKITNAYGWQTIELEQLSQDVYSGVPKYLREALGEPIEFTPFDVWPAEAVFMDPPKVYAKQDLWAEVISYNDRSNFTDRMGHISMLGSEATEDMQPLKEEFIKAFGDKKRKVIRFKQLCSGRAPEAIMSIENQSAKQASSIGRMFLYKTQSIIWDPTTDEKKIVDVVLLGMFEAMTKVRSYKKMASTMVKLMKLMHKNSCEQIFDPDSWAETLREKAKNFTQYHSGWLGLLEDQNFENAQEVNRYQEEPHMTDQRNPSIGIFSNIKSSEEYGAYRRSQRQLGKLQKRLNQYKIQNEEKLREVRNHRIALRHEKETLEAKKEQLRAIEESVKRAKHRVDYSERTLDTAEETAKPVLESLSVMKEACNNSKQEVEATYETFKTLSQQYINAGNRTPWFSNFETSGVRVLDIVFQKGKHTVSLKSAPEAPFQSGWTMHKVVFCTKAPNKIYIDKHEHGENAEALAGGPYIMEIERGGPKGIIAHIQIASSQAIFGYNHEIIYNKNVETPNGNLYVDNRIEVFAHPHARPHYVQREGANFIKEVTSHKYECCLGEVIASMLHAFKNEDARTLIQCGLTWLSCANTADDWGRNYVFFPPLSAVNLEETPEPEIEPEEDCVIDQNTLLESLMSLQNNQPRPAAP